MDEKRKIPLKAAAEALGCTVRQLQILAKRGMPHEAGESSGGGRKPYLVDLEEIRKWGIINDVRAFRIPAPQSKPVPSETPPISGEEPAMDIGARLKRMKIAELRAYNDYAAALKIGEPSNIVSSRRGLMEVSRRVSEMEKQKDWTDEIWQQVREQNKMELAAWMTPIRSFLDAMPRSLATRFSPCEPARAEEVLND